VRRREEGLEIDLIACTAISPIVPQAIIVKLAFRFRQSLAYKIEMFSAV
jgi:hypothetical protein